MEQDRPSPADDDPRGRPVVLHVGVPATATVRSARRAPALLRGVAAAGVAVSLAAGTTVVVTEVLAPSLPQAQAAAPLWFRPPPPASGTTGPATPEPATASVAPVGERVPAPATHAPTAMPRTAVVDDHGDRKQSGGTAGTRGAGSSSGTSGSGDGPRPVPVADDHGGARTGSGGDPGSGNGSGDSGSGRSGSGGSGSGGTGSSGGGSGSGHGSGHVD